MRRKKKEGIQWLEFELLADVPGLTHAVFLRHGGFSRGPYDSLNAGSPDDEPENIKRNLEKIREVMGIPLISRLQCHTKNVEFIPMKSSKENGDCDGLITKEKHLGLMIKHADCQAAIFYDPRQRAIANVHCGWRGNVQNIYAETIAKMREQAGSRPEDILVCVSPSLGPDASEFINYKQELPEEFLPFQFKPLYFNLWEISRYQLLNAGIQPEHIEIAGICTYSNSDDFFSFRRDKRITGHHATVVGLKCD
jgi:polyphenol oxidase